MAKQAKKGTKKGSTKKGSTKSKAGTKAKGDGEGRKYKDISEMSERMQAFQERFKDAIAVIGARMVLEHNRGLFLVQMPDGTWQVGRLSSTGKSFKAIYKGDDREEAVKVYRENRSGNYGKDAKATSGKSGKGGSKKGKKSSGKKKSSSKKAEPEPEDEDDDDLEGLID